MKKWFKKTFPKATIWGQIRKFDEELLELNNAKTKEEKTEELADIFIVCQGFHALKNKGASGNCLANFLYNDNVEAFLDNDCLEITRVYNAVKDKFERNKKRQWQYLGDGVAIIPGHAYKMSNGETYKCLGAEFSQYGARDEGWEFANPSDSYVFVNKDGKTRIGTKVIEDLGEF